MEPINGVQVKPLKLISDERGTLGEILRSDDECFKNFGQAYFTTAYPGVVKAWHYHKIQWDHFACVHGLVKLVLYDTRAGSPSKGRKNEFFVGPLNPVMVVIPPDVYHGFKCVSEHECIMINLPTEPYNCEKPDEYRLPWNDCSIPYDWSRKNG